MKRHKKRAKAYGFGFGTRLTPTNEYDQYRKSKDFQKWARAESLKEVKRHTQEKINNAYNREFKRLKERKINASVNDFRNGILFNANSKGFKPSIQQRKKLESIEKQFKNFKIIDKKVICKERKERRNEIMRKTKGKGLSIKEAKWTDESKIRCK